MYKQILFFFAAAALFSGCSYYDSYDADVHDPRLPEYSDFGANTAGAYINDVPWRTQCIDFNDECIGKEIRYVDSLDQSIIQFPSGTLGYQSTGISRSARLRFVLDGNFIGDFTSGPAALPYLIELDGQSNYGEVWLWNGSEWDTCDAGTGNLYIRHIKGNFERLEISGTFGFNIDTECGTYRVESGRFDFTYTDYASL